MAKHKFKEGDEVAHVANLKKKMFVNRILYEDKKIYAGTENGERTHQVKRFITGIECYWYMVNKGSKTDEQEYDKNKFHSKHLIPWEIAEKGHDDVYKWIDERQ